MEVVTFPMRLMAAVGVQRLVLTNAAGGISADLNVGDFMQITDHINLMGENPLRGTVTEGRTRFVDMADAYSAELGQALGQVQQNRHRPCPRNASGLRLLFLGVGFRPSN